MEEEEEIKDARKKLRRIEDKADCTLYHKTIVVKTVISFLKLEPLI